LPDTLLESELFGYRKGAFTGADGNKPGRFDLADGGTIFLDEIGDISAALQIKLLRVLQEKQYEPLGGTTSRRVDVRVVTATNKNLKEQMRLGRFRDDLYFRLNVICLEIPPLAERKVDIPILIEALISRFNTEKQKNILGVTPGTMRVLMQYEYPGNVRELENIMERAFILCKTDLIDVDCLPREVVPDGAIRRTTVCGELTPLESAEAEAIVATLTQNDGHRERTATALGIHKTTLLRKMKKLGITYP
jgi:transcriptional regulator with PAS, ATPase and Fis domain